MTVQPDPVTAGDLYGDDLFCTVCGFGHTGLPCEQCSGCHDCCNRDCDPEARP
jgi:hypothetical protein